MKLLLYSHFFAPSIGGVETIVLGLARGLAKLRDSRGSAEFEITLVTQTARGNDDDRSLPFPVVRQPGLFQLWELIQNSDVIHVAGPSLAPLVFAKAGRKPMVIEHHGYQAICPNGLLVQQPDRSICPGYFQTAHYRKCWRCQRSELSFLQTLVSLLLMFPRHWLSRKAAANLAVSHHVKKRHVLPRSSVVYYGIENSFKSDVASSPESARLCFAYVGRFFPEKGVATLLEATSLLRKEGLDFEVLLIGDGPLRVELEGMIQQHHLESHVRIAGFLSGARLAQALEGVAVVVMPSVCEETAGLAAIEQMMRGRLVIASKIGGLAEIVDDTGLTFPAGDARALAECMKAVIKDSSLIDSLGRKARGRTVRMFLQERMVEQHAEVYREVFGRRMKRA